MTKTTYENEQLKREFFQQLKGGDGFAQDSITKFAEAIFQWETFTGFDDFANFSKEKAAAFVGWLQSRKAKTSTGKLSLRTQDNYLRRLKKFFLWLADHPEYRKRVLKNDVNFLRLSKKETRIARSGTTRQMPTFEEVRTIIESIEPRNEVDMRDRAIICFALITGSRISAYASLRMKNFDKDHKVIDQNPGDGVRTKYSKKILTTFFPIGWDAPERYFIEWYSYLQKEGFQPDDPIFPATLKGVGSAGYSKELVGRTFWSASDPARKIFKKRCAEAGVRYFNPHSFRHLVVNIMSKTPLTEEQKRAISFNLGHADVSTTFGTYGYGNMSNEDAIKIVQRLRDSQGDENGTLVLTDVEKADLRRIMNKLL